MLMARVDFHVCTCGQHGYIALGGAEEVADFHSRAQAQLTVELFQIQGRVTEHERAALMLLIEESNLPDFSEEDILLLGVTPEVQKMIAAERAADVVFEPIVQLPVVTGPPIRLLPGMLRGQPRAQA